MYQTQSNKEEVSASNENIALIALKSLNLPCFSANNYN